MPMVVKKRKRRSWRKMKNSDVVKKYRKLTIFISHGRRGVRCSSNGHRFDYHASTSVWWWGNRARGARFLEGEATILVTEAKFNWRDDRAMKDAWILTRQFNIEHIFNLVHRWIKMPWRLIQVMGRSKSIELYDLVLKWRSLISDCRSVGSLIRNRSC
jgi:hypothetical protein